MANVVVKVEDFPAIFKDYAHRLKGNFRAYITNAVINSIPLLVKKSPVDTGEFASSWDIQVTRTGLRLGNYAPHAPIIEYGARPFRPPIRPLLDWAKRVLQDGSQPPKYSKEVWGLAVGTQKKIEEWGMFPRHILTTHMRKLMIQIRQNIRHELERLQTGHMGKITKKFWK